MLDATEDYSQPLTQDRLFGWHVNLFPTGRSGLRRITVGGWRDDSSGPMQVVSGPIGHERVHFEAPAANRLDQEMEAFLDWFNTASRHRLGAQGRIGSPLVRYQYIHSTTATVVLLELLQTWPWLALRSSPQRFYSMSSQIQKERSAYYNILERTQKGTTDVSEWMTWFVGCLDRAIANAEKTLNAVLEKARFWERTTGISINERQRVVINRLLDGFEGKLTTSRWARMVHCSQDTALRDITDLMEHGILSRGSEGGRSTSYDLVKTAAAS